MTYDLLYFKFSIFDRLVEEKYYLSDTTFHLFLQTNLTIKEIKEYIEGHMTTYPLDSLWKANGIKENCRYPLVNVLSNYLVKLQSGL